MLRCEFVSIDIFIIRIRGYQQGADMGKGKNNVVGNDTSTEKKPPAQF